jgi:CheY-like chemotaxis protein
MEIEHLKNYNVLYAEDSKTIREQLGDILKELFNDVFIASDGQEAIEIYDEKNLHIDLVITDIQMPRADGIELSKYIKSNNKDVPIIITTAFDDTKYLMESIEIGVNKFVVKPVKFDKLMDGILEVMAIYFQRKEIVKKNEEIIALLATFEQIVYNNDFDLDKFRDKFANREKNIKYEDIELFFD